MKIAICDDNPEDLHLMLEYCKQYDSSLSVYTFPSGKALIHAFSSTFYDIIFLDIEMEPPNGYKTALALRAMERKPILIFTTQNLNYSIRRYGIGLQYLPKPISYEIFVHSLHQALQLTIPPKIMIPYQGAQKLVQVSDIIYIEVIRHQVIFHMINSSKLEFRGSLKDIMEQIESTWFVQCHKSFCVNLNYIDRVTAQNVFMINQVAIPIGRNKKEYFEKRLQEFLKGGKI